MRLAEQFQATTDAVSRVVARALSKRPPRVKAPWYLEPEGGPAPGLTPETGLDEAILRLGQRTGRVVERTPEGNVSIATFSPRVH